LVATKSGNVDAEKLVDFAAGASVTTLVSAIAGITAQPLQCIELVQIDG